MRRSPHPFQFRSLTPMVVAVLVLGLVVTSGVSETIVAQEATPGVGTAGDGGHAADAAALDAELQAALAASDADAVAALFAPNGVEINPFGVFTGRDEIRGFSEELIATNPGLEVSFSKTEVVLNTAVHRMQLSSDPIRATGVDRVVLIHTLVASDGQIVSLTAVFDTTDAQTRQYLTAIAGAAGTPEATPAS